MSEKCPKCGAPLEEDATVCHKCRFIVLAAEPDYDQAGPDTAIISAGAILQDDYRIVRLLGTGGSGTVYEARQISLQNARVALKVLHPDLNSDQGTINLLKREVIVCRELTHQNIMKVYSMEKMAEGHFIVMEYVLGGSFQDRLDKSGKMSLEKAGHVFLQACDALQYAHGRGVIHLDIKPANILLGPGNTVKLCDFGIARMAVNRVTTATQRIVTGSVGYMPPEQYRGRKAVSYRSDIYSLGATMYTALTGAVPIGIIEHEGIPRCVLRAMHRDPQDRFDSVHAFCEAFVAETGVQSDSVGTGAPASGPLINGLEDPSSLDPGYITPDEATTVEPPPQIDTGGAHEREITLTIPDIAGLLKSLYEKTAVVLAEIKAKLVSRWEIWWPTIKSAPWKEWAGNKTVLLAAGAGLAALVALGIGLSLTADPVPGKIPASKPAAGLVAKTQSQTVPPAPTETTPADGATANAVKAALSRFVGSLNFDQSDQAAALLTSAFREKLTVEKFREKFFRTPRLWRMKILSVRKAGNGRVVIKVNVRVIDAFEGTVKSRMGRLQMIKKDVGWKISSIDVG